MRKMILLLVCYLYTLNAVAQATPAKKFYYKDLEWTIAIPEGFEQLEKNTEEALRKKGMDAIEQTANTEIEDNTKSIFMFSGDKMHYMESNVQPFNTAVYGDFENTLLQMHGIVYQTLANQMPRAHIDTLSGSEKIDGLSFHTFSLTMALTGGQSMHIKFFSHLFGKKQLTLSCIYVDEQRGAIMLEACKSSKFGKK